MKTLNKIHLSSSKNRLLFRHLFTQLQFNAIKASCISTLLLFLPLTMALADPVLQLKQLDPFFQTQTRNPANFIPNDDVDAMPFVKNKPWIENFIAPDNEGVLVGMTAQLKNWQDIEEYRDAWNLKSTGLYNTPTSQSRISMVQSNILRYADKRLAGEVKNAEEGSTLAAVGKAQQALRPQAEMGNETFKLKFKAKVLQGESRLVFINPWLEQETQYKIFQNTLSTSIGKDFKTIGIKTNAQYQMTEKRWVASVDKQITEAIKANISSAQADKNMAFSSNSDKTFQFIYSRGW